MTPYHAGYLQKIKETAGQYDGVVITHRTDTLEETAYFLDTMAVLRFNRPNWCHAFVKRARKRRVYNYLSALRVASDDKAADKGILVVMNDEIHAAKYVTKTHTTNVATFHTPTHGPLGIIMKHDILWFKTAEPRVRFDLEQITGTVPIIKAYAGMGIGDGIISLLDPEKIDGVVIEALGAGNLPPLAAGEITKLMDKGVPVVLVSRCFNGIAEPVYAYEGGGVKLQEAGVMFVKELNAPKARLKLLIALSAGLKGQEMKDYIEG
ncbi:MAG: asparaginase [Streptococcus salivarius]